MASFPKASLRKHPGLRARGTPGRCSFPVEFPSEDLTNVPPTSHHRSGGWMTSPREQTRAPLANSEAKKRKRGAGGGSERRRLGKLPWRSRPCKETPRRGCPVRTELRDERREGRGATRGSPASPPAEALGQDSHSAWRGSSASPRPPRWRPARSRRASSPTKRVAPPGGVTFSSRPGSGSCCSPSACGHPPLRPGRRCPGSRRLQV